MLTVSLETRLRREPAESMVRQLPAVLRRRTALLASRLVPGWKRGSARYARRAYHHESEPRVENRS